MESLTLTAYARRRGVSHVAVSKAISGGRLTASVGRDPSGRPTILDPDLADREWAANTQHKVERAPAQPKQPAPPRAAVAPVQAAPPPEPPTERRVTDYNEARARKEAALADMAELDLAERRGELVSADEARSDVIERFSVVRTKLLGVPTRLAQRMPHVAADIVPVLDELLREALEELAVDGRDSQ